MSYTPTTWSTGDVITAEKLNKLEQGVQNEQVGPQGPKGDKDDTGPQGPKGDTGETGPQGPAGAGLTGSAAAVEAIATPESADAPTIANKVNEIITQLKARGVVS